MAVLSLNLPRDVPWKLIAVSPDMIDTQFCDRDYPPPWRSSMAISVYEPKLDELPEELCEDRITYLKITCSITGYQAPREEIRDLDNAVRGWVPRDRLQSILQEYFACYGVLLNVSVFPFPQRRRERERISIDFEDLRQERPSITVDNPLERGEASFYAQGRRRNRIVDLSAPTTGFTVPQGYLGLDLSRVMEISLPQSARVEAKVLLSETLSEPAPVTMEAYSATGPVGTRTTDPERGRLQELAIDGDRIERVTLRTPPNGGYLVEFRYDAWRETPVVLQDYPHIIDFEPKVRDLYQAATESGEILTASVSSVKTDKSFTHTETTETGLSIGSMIGGPVGGLTASLSGNLSHKWGETTQDRWQVQTDSSRDRRERNAVTTNLSQMYNLLTGYHAGTNRAAFLMLPRPHILQPTDHRTFIQGLRIIEGIQEFFLIVARPKEIEGLSIEAILETGHFPEHVEIAEPAVEYEESYEDFEVTAYLRDEQRDIETFPASKHTIGQGWIIDRRKGDQYHPGIEELEETIPVDLQEDPATGRIAIHCYNYQPLDDSSVQVFGTLDRRLVAYEFGRAYRVYTRSEQPKPSSREPVVTSPFLIASRSLCTGFSSGENCPEVIPFVMSKRAATQSIIEERTITLDSALLTPDVTQQTRLPAIKETLRQIQFAMTGSGRLPTRRPYGTVGFVESDYVRTRLLQAMSTEALERPLTSVSGLPHAVLERLGQALTVREALSPDLSDLADRTGLSIEQVANARRLLLGLSPKMADDDGQTLRLPAAE